VPQSMYEIRRYTKVNSLGGATVLEAAVNTKGVRDRLRKLVVASSKSIYGEGAYRCAAHGTVYPRFRPLAQLERREWAVRCPVPDCGRSLTSLPTDEDKPLMPVNIYAIGKRDHEEMFLAVGHTYGIPAVALRYWQEADYQTINVGTGQPMSVLDVAWTLIREMGADSGGMAPEILGRFRPGDTRDCYPDISRARRLLGYEPQVSFQEGAKELVAWVREQRGKAEDRFEQSQRELRERGLA
jgi:dTDP-L-rhamnose 4-epimerase